MSENQVARWVGGSPLGVLVRLILVSILVGVILSALGLDPFDIIQSVQRLIRSIWNMGFDAIRWLWRYFLLGAVIVIPIWFIMRMVNTPRGKVNPSPAIFRGDGRRIVADHRCQRVAWPRLSAAVRPALISDTNPMPWKDQPAVELQQRRAGLDLGDGGGAGIDAADADDRKHSSART